jgi:hypothetical protein
LGHIWHRPLTDMEKDNDRYNEILARLTAIQSLAINQRVDSPPEKIPLIDPTANVLQLVGKETQRQDDLREYEA